MTVPLTVLEVPDYDIGLRGKMLRAEKLTGDSGAAFCTIVHGLSVVDEVTDTLVSNQGNGYPDEKIVIDESTRVELPWRSGSITAVIGDLADAEGVPVPASPRGQVARLQERFAGHGLVPTLGFEYELWIFEAAAGVPVGTRGPTGWEHPLGGAENAYSLSRVAQAHDLAVELVDRLEQVGVPVEAFHSELGPGFFEFALMPQPALRAADGAARAKQYLRELAAERGLRVSFMAKPFADRSGAGGHVHSSLARDGANAFASEPGRLSDVGRGYVAGLLETLGDLTALFNPFVNSFKRLDKEMYVAETATWGVDDRGAACRVLLGSMAGARVEHRRPGADANPYLVTAGLLAGGLVGIEEGLALQESGRGDDSSPLPGDLGTAIARFEGSRYAKEAFGETFVQAYAATRRAELAAYERWLRATITDWEMRRYGDHL
jgi:glutamine synthetase